MASPALPGLFFCFAACVLLIFVSVSAPTWNAISFLNIFANGRSIHFGCFGYTGTHAHLGYNFDPSIVGINDLSNGVVHNLTFLMILHPIAAGLAGLAVLFGFCGAGYHRAGTVIMSLLAGLATLVTTIVWIVDMVLWGIARDRFRDHGVAAQYGNANWLTLGALIALFLAFCMGICGSCGSYRKTGRYY